MHAAIIERFGDPPRYGVFPEPVPGDGQRVVRMRAAAVHQVVRGIASGRHYGASGRLPFVPGVDGVAITENDDRIYTGGCPEPFGTLAERTLVPDRFAIPVPDGVDDAQAAALVNPAMSSLLPLRGVAALAPGQTVAVVGATGTAGRLALQLARHLGAGRIVAVGRDVADRVDVDEVVRAVELHGTDDEVVEAIRAAAPEGIDVVLDYLWGDPGRLALEALRRRGMSHVASRTTYVQIGDVAGGVVPVDAGLLRASNVQITGSGAGSIEPAEVFRVIPEVLDLAASGVLTVPVVARPLADVESAWDEPGRLVLTC